MIPTEEILDNIRQMGYLTIKPIVISQSYYKLNDGTILQAHVNVDSIISDKGQPDGYSIRTSNFTIAYVPKEERKPQGFIPFNPAEIESSIIDEDVSYEPLSEGFSEYELSNGMVLSIRTVVGQIKKTKFYTEQGEPVYTVSISPVYKLKKSTGA